jgi:hypothetical protein
VTATASGAATAIFRHCLRGIRDITVSGLELHLLGNIRMLTKVAKDDHDP